MTRRIDGNAIDKARYAYFALNISTFIGYNASLEASCTLLPILFAYKLIALRGRALVHGIRSKDEIKIIFIRGLIARF